MIITIGELSRDESALMIQNGCPKLIDFWSFRLRMKLFWRAYFIGLPPHHRYPPDLESQPFEGWDKCYTGQHLAVFSSPSLHSAC